MNSTENRKNKIIILLWTALGVLILGLMFARAIAPDLIWLTIALAVALAAVLFGLVYQNQKIIKSRTAAFGLNSAITVALVLAIVGVLNFLASKYPAKLDLTKNKIHTLSDQTVKILKDAKKPIKAVYFSSLGQREQARPLLENLKGINPKMEIEYVDPNKEPTRVKQVGIKKDGTLQLIVGDRDQKIEDLNEEKITNALIRLGKEKLQTLCAISGHGEKPINSNEADGYSSVKKALENQSYEIKEINLVQEGKIPDNCNAIAILGPTKAFFAPEIKTIGEYLSNGGRAVIALDMNIKGGQYAPELSSLLEKWQIKSQHALIIDPLSRMFGVDAAVPIVATFSKDHTISKDVQGNCIFPITHPLEIIPGAPAGMNVQWLAQTTPKSWAESDMNELAKGEVKADPGKDKMGPLTVAVAVEGKQKDSKATKSTRLVVFGTSQFASNNYSRAGLNLDFFMNSVSWILEDENLISIRAKEESLGRIELSVKAGRSIFLLTVLVIPLLVFVGGIVVWAIRRRL